MCGFYTEELRKDGQRYNSFFFFLIKDEVCIVAVTCKLISVQRVEYVGYKGPNTKRTGTLRTYSILILFPSLNDPCTYCGPLEVQMLER